MSGNGIVKLVLKRQGLPAQNIPMLPDANDFTAWFETKRFDLDLKQDKYVDQIVLEIDPFTDQENMEVFIIHSQRIRDAGIFLGPFLVDPSDRAIFPRFTARYISFRFVDRRPAVLWKLTSIKIFGRPVGGRD